VEVRTPDASKTAHVLTQTPSVFKITRAPGIVLEVNCSSCCSSSCRCLSSLQRYQTLVAVKTPDASKTARVLILMLSVFAATASANLVSFIALEYAVSQSNTSKFKKVVVYV